ncbi:hypothetical protein CCAN12_810127 [Capnocytophaga canimorsus]|uniref:Uncharacterized protein n=1 Tax=Capnocytophaga canimorsus TaxID=28188 RepID=A0A0B7HSQ4_9FLAO|nr:hypothetical protein CCAN12_810127 [Capnocytophaga canimorsus]
MRHGIYLPEGLWFDYFTGAGHIAEIASSIITMRPFGNFPYLLKQERLSR